MPRPIPLFRVDGALVVFGGPYSNLEATRAVLGEAARLEIPADRLILPWKTDARCGRLPAPSGSPNGSSSGRSGHFSLALARFDPAGLP
jgi:hypothetical protein